MPLTMPDLKYRYMYSPMKPQKMQMVKTWNERPASARSTPIWLVPADATDKAPPAAWITSDRKSQGTKIQ